MKRWLKQLEAYMVAVTFAEAGEQLSALEFLPHRRRKSKIARSRPGAVEKKNRPTMRA
jgi:hypothetical protein